MVSSGENPEKNVVAIVKGQRWCRIELKQGSGNGGNN